MHVHINNVFFICAYIERVSYVSYVSYVCVCARYVRCFAYPRVVVNKKKRQMMSHISATGKVRFKKNGLVFAWLMIRYATMRHSYALKIENPRYDTKTSNAGRRKRAWKRRRPERARVVHIEIDGFSFYNHSQKNSIIKKRGKIDCLQWSNPVAGPPTVHEKTQK